MTGRLEWLCCAEPSSSRQSTSSTKASILSGTYRVKLISFYQVLTEEYWYILDNSIDTYSSNYQFSPRLFFLFFLLPTLFLLKVFPFIVSCVASVSVFSIYFFKDKILKSWKDKQSFFIYYQDRRWIRVGLAVRHQEPWRDRRHLQHWPGQHG